MVQLQTQNSVTTNPTTRNSKKFKRTEAAVGDVDSQYSAWLRKVNLSRADENDPDNVLVKFVAIDETVDSCW
jgi:hypothetical protein